MIGIVGIGSGDTGEHILIGLTRHQVAVVERGLAEIGQQRIARRVSDDFCYKLEFGAFLRADSHVRLTGGRGYFTLHCFVR